VFHPEKTYPVVSEAPALTKVPELLAKVVLAAEETAVVALGADPPVLVLPS
jgi:hypothetical protein